MERVPWEWDRKQVAALDFAPRERVRLFRVPEGTGTPGARAVDSLPVEAVAAGSLAEAGAGVSKVIAGAGNGSVWVR